MKKAIPVLCFLFLSLVACKKNNDDTNYHLSFSADGNVTNYTAYVISHYEFAGGFTELTINGTNSAASSTNYLGFYINNAPVGNPINEGVYTGTTPNFTLLSTYSINGVDYEAGVTMEEEAVSNGVTINNHLTLTITSISATEIKGTFSGDFFENGDVQNGNIITITNGEFKSKVE